jgi:peptidyl-prolyl cis-trans isomerase A (cyclophilin A)
MPAVVALTATLAAASVTAAQKPPLPTVRAPQIFRADFETSKGRFVVEVHRSWAPLGADRFYNLVKNGFYDDCRFFRVIDSLLAQAGINADAKIEAEWAEFVIEDDPPKESNSRGSVVLASAGPNSRSTQFFINLANNGPAFDRRREVPIGRIVAGMEVVSQLYSGYGDGPPRGRGPVQERIKAEGNSYLLNNFPKLDFVKKARRSKNDGWVR